MIDTIKCNEQDRLAIMICIPNSFAANVLFNNFKLQSVSHI